MLAEAEKYAAADKEKRETIDLKNQAEALCFEAEKELSLLKDNISEDKQENITKLIEDIRKRFKMIILILLKSKVEDLKTAMKDMIASKMNDQFKFRSNVKFK
jgi:molecular chaperone DnaK (HSP70)